MILYPLMGRGTRPERPLWVGLTSLFAQLSLSQAGVSGPVTDTSVTTGAAMALGHIARDDFRLQVPGNAADENNVELAIGIT